MKLKHINSKLNTKLEDICKNLKSTLPKLIQDCRDESPGWGCFVMASKYTFVHADSENSESIDPEFGISYFIVKQYSQGESELTEFGVSPKINAENHLTSFKFVKDDNDQWVEHYCYGKYCGPDKSLWQKELVQAYSTGKLLPVKGVVPPDFTGIVESLDAKLWYRNGKYHREDGPAYERADGLKQWYLNGQLHRTDGPAWEWADGSKLWWLNGQHHRVDGPAIERSDGEKQWWLNGKRYSETEWEKLVKGESLTSASAGVTVATEAKVSKVEPIKVKTSSKIPKGFTGIVEYPNGSKLWYRNGKYHREDGPAIEHSDGTKEWRLNGNLHRVDGPALEGAAGLKQWYLNGQLHRTDGPAWEWADGTKQWWLNGQLHRTDGPAGEWADGIKDWWLNGKRYSETEWEKLVKAESLTSASAGVTVATEAKMSKVEPIKVKTSSEIPKGFTGIVEYPDSSKLWYRNGKYHREDGPAYEDADGTREWWLNGQRHRVDGPAVEYADGTREWWLNGQRHRVDGPAVEYPDGVKQWWLNGKQYSETEWEKLVKAESLTSASAGVTVATEAKVSKKVESFKDIVVSDSKMVARRIAVEKIAKLVQGLLTQAFTSNVKGKNKKLMQTQLGEFFSTENGKAIIKFVMGCVAPFIKSHVPEKYHGVIDDVATEARVQGETTAILQAVEMIQPMISMLSSSVMQSLETLVAVDEKVRVHVEMDSPEVYHETVAVAPNVAATA